MRNFAKICIIILCLTGIDARAQHNDWADFERYSQNNNELIKRPKAVLMGDSITDS